MEAQGRQLLSRSSRELFKTHPDREWLYRTDAAWNMHDVSNLDDWSWWECQEPPKYPAVSGGEISADLLRLMQLYEAALRLSAASQKALSSIYHGASIGEMDSHEQFVESLQQHVVTAAGAAGDMAAALHVLRMAQTTFAQPRNAAKMETGEKSFVPHHVRFNRLFQGSVTEGGLMQDTALATMTASPASLLNCLRALATSGPGTQAVPCPIVVVASSLT